MFERLSGAFVAALAAFQGHIIVTLLLLLLLLLDKKDIVGLHLPIPRLRIWTPGATPVKATDC